jgi:MraZ protein
VAASGAKGRGLDRHGGRSECELATRFVGRYEHSLDGKGRIILPARFRTSFETLALVSKHNERCLAIWTPDAFDRKADEMALLLDGTPDERARARAWSMGSAEVDLDRQGRVAIPAYLREFAGLSEGGTVLVHGALNHVELWHPDVWQVHGAAGDAALTGDLPSSNVPNPEGQPDRVSAGQQGKPSADDPGTSAGEE